VLGLPVAATTLLTATWAAGALAAFALAARRLAQGAAPMRLAAQGALVGTAAFAAVIASGPLGATPLFFAGSLAIGFGGGLFAVATLIAAMQLPAGSSAMGGARGLALGAWGAAQATAQGLSAAAGGGLRDGAAALLPEAQASTPYAVVYAAEIALLALTLVLLAPLLRRPAPSREYDRPAPTGPEGGERLGLADFPT
jgi:BCD family chlorophyll transporter-like MFS transporter